MFGHLNATRRAFEERERIVAGPAMSAPPSDGWAAHFVLCRSFTPTTTLLCLH